MLRDPALPGWVVEVLASPRASGYQPWLFPQPGETEAREGDAVWPGLPKQRAAAGPHTLSPGGAQGKPGASGCVPPTSPSITSPFAGEQMSVLAKKRSDRGRRSAFHMTCPGTEDVFVNPASCQFSLFTKGINHLLLLSPLTPDPPARPPLCCLEEAGKQFRLWLPPPCRWLRAGSAYHPAGVGNRCGGTPSIITATSLPLPGRICAPAASPGSCCGGTGLPQREGGGSRTTSLPPSLPGLLEQLARPPGLR